MSRDIKKAFLQEVKKLVGQGKVDFAEREYHTSKGNIDYVDALAECGLTDVEQAWDEVLSLKVSHYKKGPVPDRDRPGDIWVFKKVVNGERTYIKLKIDDRGCVCLSFHPDRPPYSKY